MSSYIQADTAEEAEERWDEMYNPMGFEVIGHPWRDGNARLVTNPEELEEAKKEVE